MYCQSCGSEIGQDYIICPYCGQMNSNSDTISEKDIEIQELEKKVADLEQIIEEGPRSIIKRARLNQFQPWIFIFPIIFMVLFFVLFMLLVSIR